jgi:hypothetical protein
MALVSKHGLYQFALIMYATAVAGAVIVIGSGNAEPYVSASRIPVAGPLQFAGLIAALVLPGAIVLYLLEKRSWNRAGRNAGLTPAGMTFVGKPTLEGTVDGRTVRARTVTRKVGGGGEGGPNRTTYTVVEADLDAAVDDSVVLAGASDSATPAGVRDVDFGPNTTEVRNVAAIGDESIARDVVTPAVSDALATPKYIGAVYAGDAESVLLEAFPEGDGGMGGYVLEKLEDEFADRLPGDASTVSTESKGVVLSATEFEAQTRAVAAVADALEATLADTASTGSDAEATSASHEPTTDPEP